MHTLRWLKNAVSLLGIVSKPTCTVFMKKESKTIERFECMNGVYFLPGCLPGPEAHRGLLNIYRGDINDGRVWLFL